MRKNQGYSENLKKSRSNKLISLIMKSLKIGIAAIAIITASFAVKAQVTGVSVQRTLGTFTSIDPAEFDDENCQQDPPVCAILTFADTHQETIEGGLYND